MPGSDAAAIATQYLRSWTSGDLDRTRTLVTDDVTFVGPLGEASGVDSYIGALTGMSKMVERAEIESTVADDDNVAIKYQLVTNTPAGAISTVNWFEVRGDKIAAVRAFFDPRPLLESAPG